MILVSGAGGKTGRAVVRALATRGASVRALARGREHVEPLTALGAQDVVLGDMRDPATWSVAVQGIRALYYICPNMEPEETAMGGMAIDAARRAGVVHFVYHSVLHPQTEAMPHHWQKLRVEERLFESGLPYTILQPAPYMQNVLAGWETIMTRGLYRVPYAAETRIGMVDLEDVAEAAALVLTQAGHDGATYELAGSEALNQREVASVLAQELGRSVRADVVPLDAWAQEARTSGLGAHQIRTLLAMFRYYEQFGLCGNPHVLAWLLNRPPTPFAAFVIRIRQERQT